MTFWSDFPDLGLKSDFDLQRVVFSFKSQIFYINCINNAISKVSHLPFLAKEGQIWPKTMIEYGVETLFILTSSKKLTINIGHIQIYQCLFLLVSSRN